MIRKDARALIDQLESSPEQFYARGGSYSLLQRLFHERDLSIVIPLLESSDPHVNAVGLFCASELGTRAYPLVDAVIPFTSSLDVKTARMAIEVLAVCSTLEHANDYWHVLKCLQSSSVEIRVLVMDLMVHSEVAQFIAASESRSLPSCHGTGLHLLMKEPLFEEREVLSLLHSEKRLDVRYGAVIMIRNRIRSDLLSERTRAAVNSDAVEGDDISLLLQIPRIQGCLRSTSASP
ncbi:MAG: hypothetical protein ABI183_14165 [Polyangiaceae bacterium]